MSKIRIVHISDTHQEFVKIPECDLVIHSGDYSFGPKNDTLRNRLNELANLNNYFGGKQFEDVEVILVPGNHDWIFETDELIARQVLSNCTVLIDEEVTAKGLTIYGTPSQPPFCDWAFNHDTELRNEKYNAIPDHTDILVTHCPPYGVLDHCRNGHVGCEMLMQRIKEVSPKLHCFGHIHEGYGQVKVFDTIFSNGSIMDGFYDNKNKPRIIEIE